MYGVQIMVDVGIQYSSKINLLMEEGKVHPLVSSGTLFFPTDKEKAVNILNSKNIGHEVSAYCFVFFYNQECAEESINNVGNRVVGGMFFKNVAYEDISAKCLNEQSHYEKYSQCDSLLAELLGNDLNNSNDV